MAKINLKAAQKMRAEGKTLKEIAEVYDSSESAVHQLLTKHAPNPDDPDFEALISDVTAKYEKGESAQIPEMTYDEYSGKEPEKKPPKKPASTGRPDCPKCGERLDEDMICCGVLWSV